MGMRRCCGVSRVKCALACRRWTLVVLLTLSVVDLLQPASAGGPPRVKPLTPRKPRPLIAVVGESRVRVPCPIEADPAPIGTTWRKDGREIPPGWERFRIKRDGTLIVSDLESGDTGLYACRTVNGFGAADYEIVLYVLGVGGGDSPRVEAEPQQPSTKPPAGPRDSPADRANAPRFIAPFLENVTVDLGSEVVLQCHVTSNMPPHIQWLKRVDTPHDAELRQNATLSVDGRRFVVLQIGAVMALANASYLSKMTLSPRHELDAGMYYCVATNQQGYDYHGAYVSVGVGEGAPRDPDDPRYTHAPSSSILPAIVAIIVVTSLVVLCGLAAYYVTRCRAAKSARRDVTLAAPLGNATDGQSHGSGAQESERGGLCCEQEQYQILASTQRYANVGISGALAVSTNGGLRGGSGGEGGGATGAVRGANFSPYRSKFKVSPEHQGAVGAGGTRSPQAKVRYDAVPNFGDFTGGGLGGGHGERYYNGFGVPLSAQQNLVNTHRSCYCGDA